MKTARDIMTTPVISVSPETGIEELAKILTAHRISGAPVVDDDGFLLGIVTETDLLYTEKPMHIPTFFTILDAVVPMENPFRMDREMKKLTAATVRDIYTADCLTLTPDDPVEKIAALMLAEHKHLLPVIDAGRRVAGIVSRTDMLTLISRYG
ncbi:MAG: CBS domain-containing protein [Deltaproteobacteria bacterium]|nr:CBS domain-containing protein [Candidatus Anaeroferrophillacea bacterium]